MNGQHQRTEGPERKFCDARECRLENDRKSAHLQSDNASYNRCEDDLRSLRRVRITAGKQPALHDRAPDQIVSDKAPVKGHVPYVGPQSHQPSVGKKETLYGQHNDHGQKARLRPQKRGQKHSSAHMPRRAGSGNRIVDHLPGKDQGGRHCHGGQFLRIIVLFESLD